MGKLFIRIYDFFEQRRVLLYSLFIALLSLFGWFASQLKFEEDISKILPRDQKIEKLNQVFQQSKFMDKLVVMVSLKDSSATEPDSLVAFADDMVDAIREKLNPFVAKISDKVDDGLALELFGTINDHLPIYLDDRDYQAIDSLITPGRIRQTLEQDLRTLTSPAGFALKQMISQDPVGISFLGLKKIRQLQYDENFELYDNYVFTRDQRNLLFFITPAFPPNNTGKNALLLSGLDDVISQLSKGHYPNIQTRYFGATAVSVGNALQLRRDSLLTQGVTVLFIIIFLGFYFRKKRAPFIILLPVLFGGLFSLAAIYFIKGQISVIALGTGSVILGIAVNYSLHVFNHYRHTRNIRDLINDLAMPMTVGSFTTIGGFLCLEFVKSEMLKDLGLFAAFSLIGASLCSLIFLPHFIASRKENHQQLEVKRSWIDRIAGLRPEYNKYLVLLILALTAFFAWWAPKVSFESDMQRMNFMAPSLKASEDQLNRINAFALQSVYLVTEGNTLNQALIHNEKLSQVIDRLQEQGVVKKYSGVSSLIISDSLQKARIEKWTAYWTPEKKKTLLATLDLEGRTLKFNPSAFAPFAAMLDREFTVAGDSVMASVRRNFLDDYITEKPGHASVVTLLKVSAGDKKQVYDAFEKNPDVTVLDKQYLTSKFVEIINSDFGSIAIMTSLLVFIVLLLMYGRIELTLVSFIPMFISWVWILGIMALAGISFNIVNIIVSALIFGLGDDYSLFIMDGLLQEYKTGKKNLSSFKSSIFLSAITTIAGLGVLIFAKHPALQSIALISIIGILSVVLMSQVLIPYLFSILITNRVKRNRYPWTLMGFLKSSFAFSYFIGWSVAFTLISGVFSIFKLGEKGKLAFHTIISKVCRRLVYVMINVKKKIINPDQENFSEPAIIIANHQSSLDILPLIMLHPKLIMVTNNRIWNSPLFGKVIRLADYFPSEQIEADTGPVAERIRNGYSVIIFPEGTRSEDGTIGRFHKGAFFLAEKLQVDILPIMIHGTNYTLTKQDKLLKDGQLTVKFLPRIKPGDTRYGAGYSERAKLVGRYFREEFRLLRKEIEQPVYFREKLVYNYLYKGPVLEWYMRIKTRLEKNYRVFNDLVPEKGKILDIGCGYGFLCYMLSFTSEEREITGIDYDEDKIATAAHCFSKTGRLHFIAADVMSMELDHYDTIILADVLHYLPVADQQKLLERCLDNLNPGGKLILRDGDKDRKDLHRRTRLTETFSTRILHFNKTTGSGLNFFSGQLIRDLAAARNMSCSEIADSKLTSNTIFILTAAGGTI
ncbi:MAG: 1-acyl-sn-glycerol-3-phosphate acyltransferase [Chitinophagaceae bacterium]|nr:1-acyl-sn-glycerol-3-phosphate acyltransferase [Chitinophagaceae bacterium]